MDPYLEQYWGDVHQRLCTYSSDRLRTLLPPGLISRLEERTIIEDGGYRRPIVPDVRVVDRGATGPVVAHSGVALAEPILIDSDEPVIDAFVQILDPRGGGRIVTVIEFMSAANKASDEGRRQNKQKQQDLLEGGVNLVEVDLIRAGNWILRASEVRVAEYGKGMYHICVTRGDNPIRSAVYRVELSQKLPAIRIPLRPSDPDVVLDLQKLIEQVYENGSYGFDVDYTQQPVPPLFGADAEWANARLHRSDPAS